MDRIMSVLRIILNILHVASIGIAIYIGVYNNLWIALVFLVVYWDFIPRLLHAIEAIIVKRSESITPITALEKLKIISITMDNKEKVSSYEVLDRYYSAKCALNIINVLSRLAISAVMAIYYIKDI
jgi:hypothetical protein